MIPTLSRIVLTVCLLAANTMLSQSTIPAGTTIPVMLSTTIRSDRTRAGEPIKARVMQDVPLAGGGRIRRGQYVSGHIVAVTPTEIRLTFDRLLAGKDETPIRTSMRAVASMLAVNEAHIPTNAGGDRGTPPSLWNTVQIGGNDVVYGRPGVVLNGSTQVGKSLGDGSVFETLGANANGDCEADGGSLQAVWVFSSSACGAYGFADLQVIHFGRSEPVGQIVLGSPTRVEIRSGSGLLLRVIGP